MARNRTFAQRRAARKNWLAREVAAVAPDLPTDMQAIVTRVLNIAPKAVDLITAPTLIDESGSHPHHQKSIPPDHRRKYLRVTFSDVIPEAQPGHLTASEWFALSQDLLTITEDQILIRAGEAEVLDKDGVMSGALVEVEDVPIDPRVTDPAVRLRKNLSSLGRAAFFSSKGSSTKTLDWNGFDRTNKSIQT